MNTSRLRRTLRRTIETGQQALELAEQHQLRLVPKAVPVWLNTKGTKTNPIVIKDEPLAARLPPGAGGGVPKPTGVPRPAAKIAAQVQKTIQWKAAPKLPMLNRKEDIDKEKEKEHEMQENKDDQKKKKWTPEEWAEWEQERMKKQTERKHWRITGTFAGSVGS